MKKKLPIEMTENGIHYTLHGDYYFSDISASDSHTAIGCYGRMRKAYLEEHRPGLYTRLITSLCLNPDRRLFGGGFCLFLVYLIASMISSRNIVIKKCIYQVSSEISFLSFSRNLFHC